ncbi:MAG: hypothetical protein IKY59_06460 [Oscillospiraceae bacterium]|nr:hypothetical protein [Oscillospiraceae bacterium]
MKELWIVTAILAIAGIFNLAAFILGALSYRLGRNEAKPNAPAVPVTVLPPLTDSEKREQKKKEAQAEKERQEFEKALNDFERMLNE